MASEQRTKEQQGETKIPGGVPDNNLERLTSVVLMLLFCRAPRGTEGYPETGTRTDPTEPMPGMGGGDRNKQMGQQRQGRSIGDPSIQEDVDIDETTM